MRHCWAVLNLARTTDVRAIRRAYAVRLKPLLKGDDAGGSAQAQQALNEAYEAALEWARLAQDDGADEAPVMLPDAPEPMAPAVPDIGPDTASLQATQPAGEVVAAAGIKTEVEPGPEPGAEVPTLLDAARVFNQLTSAGLATCSAETLTSLWAQADGELPGSPRRLEQAVLNRLVQHNPLHCGSFEDPHRLQHWAELCAAACMHYAWLDMVDLGRTKSQPMFLVRSLRSSLINACVGNIEALAANGETAPALRSALQQQLAQPIWQPLDRRADLLQHWAVRLAGRSARAHALVLAVMPAFGMDDQHEAAIRHPDRHVQALLSCWHLLKPEGLLQRIADGEVDHPIIPAALAAALLKPALGDADSAASALANANEVDPHEPNVKVAMLWLQANVPEALAAVAPAVLARLGGQPAAPLATPPAPSGATRRLKWRPKWHLPQRAPRRTWYRMGSGALGAALGCWCTQGFGNQPLEVVAVALLAVGFYRLSSLVFWLGVGCLFLLFMPCFDPLLALDKKLSARLPWVGAWLARKHGHVLRDLIWPLAICHAIGINLMVWACLHVIFHAAAYSDEKET